MHRTITHRTITQKHHTQKHHTEASDRTITHRTITCVCVCGGLTIHVVDLEEEPQLVGLAAVDQQVECAQQLVQTDGAAPVGVEQSEEPLGKERLTGRTIIIIMKL